MRRLAEIAVEVRRDWRPINNGAAVSAIDAMATMGLVTEPYGLDPNGYGVIGQFLSNAAGWRGPVARRVKAELRAMCTR
ncbi:hypothetical protein DF016_10940 [Burkholderia stagnalis]|uniref:Uncharacterized protein n=1 Tax=Burkholderia stagnalis TaxID=1503054 RepID=A0ABX9YQM4_9BURK|nr:hypothetical protein DF017_12520 [Burkholderia stagnalis]RQZ19566.1 hypothetical protein DF016_10940 [Burkholderia stagnalis]